MDLYSETDLGAFIKVSEQCYERVNDTPIQGFPTLTPDETDGMSYESCSCGSTLVLSFTLENSNIQDTDPEDTAVGTLSTGADDIEPESIGMVIGNTIGN